MKLLAMDEVLAILIAYKKRFKPDEEFNCQSVITGAITAVEHLQKYNCHLWSKDCPGLVHETPSV